MHVLGGRRCLLVTVAETECEATSEYTLAMGTHIPSGMWKLARVKQLKTAGDAATTAPVWGTATNPTSGTAAYIGGLGAAGSQDSTNTAAGWVGDSTTLYARTVPNAGVNNSVTTKWYFVEGWH